MSLVVMVRELKREVSSGGGRWVCAMGYPAARDTALTGCTCRSGAAGRFRRGAGAGTGGVGVLLVELGPGARV
ncbi:hypothetical protein Sfulv_13030 [Streptomyces fulvorobeus]|uniref:Uncharacterized protein n=1 Tax=Streptomyces fulvorobeus TaxID=284028 RepID=A0A7J0C1W3_9ACTN|nr:hypothetical protein Sfulv_13030 [Streptomyces fulvorobeus]